VTLGERGCLCVTPGGAEHVPGFSVPKVVDTTGAGDAFNAAFAEAAFLANAVAALCCTKLDTLP
jgi:ribokinase